MSEGMAGHSLEDLQQISDLEANLRSKAVKIATLEGLLEKAEEYRDGTVHNLDDLKEIADLAEALHASEHKRAFFEEGYNDAWHRLMIDAVQVQILESQNEVREAKKTLKDKEHWLHLHMRELYDVKHGLSGAGDDTGDLRVCPHCGEAHEFWISGNDEPDTWFRCEKCYKFFRLSEMVKHGAPFRIEKPAPLTCEEGGEGYDPLCMAPDAEEVVIAIARQAAKAAYTLLDGLRPDEEDNHV